MNIYLISQTENEAYDTYDSAVVCVADENAARMMNPDNEGWLSKHSSWCHSPNDVTVKYIGKASEGIEEGFICKSFNAG